VHAETAGLYLADLAASVAEVREAGARGRAAEPAGQTY
jgi:hypothetical protein